MLTQLLVILTWAQATAVQLPNIYWNSSNPVFADEHSAASLTVRLRDRVNIYCPFYDRQVDNPEYLAVYMVSDFGYKKCTIYDAKPVLFCRNPYKPNFVSMVFRKFTPIPNGLEFVPGKTYYFITASSGDSEGIYNRMGGLCDKKNVRMRVYIKENADDAISQNDDVTFSYVRGAKMVEERIQLDEERPFGKRLVVEEEMVETAPLDSTARDEKFDSSAALSSLYQPISKLYHKERARLRYLMEMLEQSTTTEAPVIEYVIGYDAHPNPNFLRSSGRRLLPAIITVLSWLLLRLL